MSGEVDQVGRATISPCILPGRTVEGFYVGSKKSKKKLIRCYNKTKEIEQHSYKYYIKEVWERSGAFTDGKEVERLELALRNDEIAKIEDFDWKRLEDPEYLAGIMKMCCENFFEFREPVPPGGNVSRAKKVAYVDWDSIASTKVEKATARKAADIQIGRAHV